MTDYGHELAFGVFLTPGNEQPQRVVELAQLAEAVGLDLVTFQDHPYQPAFLDTWTPDVLRGGPDPAHHPGG